MRIIVLLGLYWGNLYRKLQFLKMGHGVIRAQGPGLGLRDRTGVSGISRAFTGFPAKGN